MKKFAIAILILILGMVIIISGCPKKEAADANTLTVWCWDPNFNIFAMNEAARIYQAANNPDFKLNVVETPWEDLQQRLITSFSARQTANLPDVVLIQDNALQKLITTFPGSFLALNGVVNLSQFAEFKVDLGTVGGTSYAVPFDNGATGTFIRRDIIEQAGLNVSDFNNITWERFLELGIIIKDKTGMPLISAVANETDLVAIMLQSAGTWFFDNDGNVFMKDNPVLRRAMELYQQMVAVGVILEVADWNAYIATFNNGNVAATIAGCWIVGSVSSQPAQSGLWAVVNTPRFGNIPSVNYSSWGGSSWAILASSKNSKLAADFLNSTFAGSVELYETILPRSGAIAAWLPAGNSPVYAQPNDFFGGQKIFEDIMNFAANVPMVKYGVFNYEARDAVGRAIADVMIRNVPIDTALETAQKNVEFLIDQ